MNNFIKQEIHRPRPVKIERDANDVIVIEGVRYHGDLFRNISLPNADVLYAVRRDEDDVVILTQIHNVDEAKEFFEEAGGFDTREDQERATQPSEFDNDLEVNDGL